MASEVSIVATKRSAVLGVRLRPITWVSTVAFFDKNFQHLDGGESLTDWLQEHADLEIRSFCPDPSSDRWVLVGQRPSA